MTIKPKALPKSSTSAASKNATTTSASPTPSNAVQATYISTFNSSPSCVKDKEKINKECAPLNKEQKEKQKAKKQDGGVLQAVRNALSQIDELGQKYYGYEKGSPVENKWMDDYCDGFWMNPNATGLEKMDEKLEEYKKGLDNAQLLVEQVAANPTRIVNAAADKMVSDLIRKHGAEGATSIIRTELIKSFFKDPINYIPVYGQLKTAKQAYKVYEGVGLVRDIVPTLAEKLGTESAQKMAKEAKVLMGEAKDNLESALKNLKEEPTGVMDEAMTISASLDDCLAARKCQLVPYKSNSKTNAKKGGGCCPGQTAHHIIPDAAAKAAGCADYSKSGSPTICLEGASNIHGSHGRAHQNLKKGCADYNKKKGVKTDAPITYEELSKRAIDAIKFAVRGCDIRCIQAQLNSYYKDCGPMIANPGTGGRKPGTTTPITVPSE
jgi:hypothetical protein